MNQDFSYKIIDTIKDEKLKPKPRWQFWLKNYVLWAMFFLAILIGSLAVAVIIYMFVNSDWEVYALVADSIAAYVFLVLPYFWILFMALFTWVAYYNLRHTKTGYRFSLSAVFWYVVFSSLVLGAFWYNFGLGQTIDSVLTDGLPFYHRYISKHSHRAQLWQQPEKGLLVGFVLSIDDQVLELKDFQGHKWEVDISNCVIPPLTNLQTGWPLRIVGEQIGSGLFRASRVMPWLQYEGNEPFILMPRQYRMPERIFINL